MAKVFISYDRGSKEIVEELVQDLRDDDHEVWFDHHLTGGQAWWENILSEIRGCEIFVAGLTLDSLESKACQRERKYAKDLRRVLLPVRLSDEVLPDSLPPELSELQWVDYSRQDREALRNLRRTFRHLPKSPSLPDSLPAAPPVPTSYVNELREKIDADSQLQLQDQTHLVFELRQQFRSGDSPKQIIELLQRLKRRRDLFAVVLLDIDLLLREIDSGRSSEDSHERATLPKPRAAEPARSTSSDNKTPRHTHFGEPIGKPLHHQSKVWSAAFDPKGERVVTASGAEFFGWLGLGDNTARIWDAYTGEPIGRPLKHQNAVLMAAFDPKGERVVTASADKTARIWDADTGETIGKPLQHQGAVFSAAFDPTSKRTVTVCRDNTAQIWGARTGMPICVLQHEDPVKTAAFDPTGERVVTACGDNTARIWDGRTGKLIGKPMQHQGTVNTAAFDPTGERVVTASSDMTARIWDARTGEPIGKPLRHQGEVRTAAFDPKGERVVTASRDWTARIWDARTGEPIGKPLQHQGGVKIAAFDPAGERIVTASFDCTARIWDARIGEPIGKPLQHQGGVKIAAFDPAGERIVTASGDKTAQIWDVRADDSGSQI